MLLLSVLSPYSAVFAALFGFLTLSFSPFMVLPCSPNITSLKLTSAVVFFFFFLLILDREWEENSQVQPKIAQLDLPSKTCAENHLLALHFVPT